MIKLKHPKTGAVVTFKWDKPTPPTDTDLDEMYASLEDLDIPAIETKPELPQASQGFLSRFIPQVKGLGEFAGRTLAAGLIGPNAQVQMGREMIEQPYNELTDTNKSLPTRLVRAGSTLIGANPDQISEDWQAGNIPALLGDVALPAAMLAGPKLLKGRTPLKSKGTLNIPEVLPAETPIPTGTRMLNAPSQPRALLPAIGETSQPARFISGKAGIADVTNQHLIDLTDQAKVRKPGTLLPEEKGQLVDIGPELAAERTIFAPKDPALLDPAFEALVPNRYKKDLFSPDKSNITLPKPKEFDIKLAQPEGGAILEKPTRPFSTQFPGETKLESLGNVIKQDASKIVDKTGLSPKVINEGLKVNPEVQKVIYDYARENDKLGPLSFAGTRLKAMGDAGIELFRKGARFTQQERFNLKDWAEPYRNAILRITTPERANFGRYVEGELPIPNDRVASAIAEWKRAEQLAGNAAEQSGMMIETASGKKIPFKKIEQGYWPRRLKQETLEQLPTKIDQMVKEGLTRKEAERIITNARKYGELILPQQHSRLGKLFEYETDAKSGLVHLESMAKSVARTKEFGRLDLAGKGEFGIADLIEQTSNPELSHSIMKRVIGRDEKIAKSLDQSVRVARTAVSWLRLQNYGISSIIGNQLPNMLRGNARQYIKSLGNFIGKNRAITDQSAALIDISHGVFEQTRKLNPMKVYGGQLAENIVRGQAAGIGEGLAKSYFRELKKNPNNWQAKKELFNLILEDVNTVIKQRELTSDQIRMAAGRNAEISQGLTAPLNIPLFASEPVSGFGTALGQMSLIFKKQAAIQSKMIKDSMKKNPVKTTALLIGFSQIAGGITGGIKSSIIGTTRGVIGNRDIGEAIEQEYEHRADYVGRFTGSDNELLNRSIDRALQSWAFGLASDMLYLALDKNAWTEFVAGPVVGGIGDIAGNVANPTQLGRESLRMLPIPGGVGTGAQRELLPTQAQQPSGQIRPIR